MCDDRHGKELQLRDVTMQGLAWTSRRDAGSEGRHGCNRATAAAHASVLLAMLDGFGAATGVHELHGSVVWGERPDAVQLARGES
jgi:hypothetical protein